MLTNLHIENIAVIESASIDFDGGFNVLTGETGAGKSILIDSINAVLGERVSRDLIRTGCEKASVSAMFSNISVGARLKIEELGFETDGDSSVLIQRLLSHDGKSNSKINGRPATASILREIADYLINIHGQHDGQALLNPEKHFSYIDALADNNKLLKSYQDAYYKMIKIKDEIKKSSINENEKARKMDLLKYQIDELVSANIEAGEREELTIKRNIYQNSEKIAMALETAYAALQGDDDMMGAVSLCASAGSGVLEAARYMNELDSITERLVNTKYELEEIANEIRQFSSQIEYDPNELLNIEARLDLLYKLSLKYGETEELMLEFLENASNELEKIELSDLNIMKLNEQLNEVLKEIKQYADELTFSRISAGENFSKLICDELKFLDMPFVRFSAYREKCDYNSNGADKIEFLISTNPGEPPKQLTKIASGGELSRIMLAIKNVLAGNDNVETMIFDEIDTGISGRAAQKVGLILRETAKGKQIICVTHLAQIAALADVHLVVEKEVLDDRTYTNVKTLDFSGRKNELARIMGSGITEKTLASAEEMLRQTFGMGE